jgi:hypothetical protein
MAVKPQRKATSAGMAGGGLAFFAFLFVVSGLMLDLGARDDNMILIDASTGPSMKDKSENRLLEALIVGLAAGAWYLVRKRPNAAPRSAYPDLAGNFAL